MTTLPLQRPRTGRVLAGVCAAIGRRFGISANLVRGLFLLSCLLPGPQFIIYLVAWIVIPAEPDIVRAPGSYSGSTTV